MRYYEEMVAYLYLARLWTAKDEQDYRLITNAAVSEFDQALRNKETQLLGTLSSVRVMIDIFVQHHKAKEKGDDFWATELESNFTASSGYYAWAQAMAFSEIIHDTKFPKRFTFERNIK